MSLSEFLTAVGSVFTSIMGWIPDVFDAMVSSPIIIVVFACAVIGTVVAFAKKILG